MAALVVVTAKMLQPLDHQEHQVKAMRVVWVAEPRLTKRQAVAAAQAHKVETAFRERRVPAVRGV
jgi:hypothetical protein